MVRETRYLLVGNLPESATENEITEYFKRFGKIQKVKVERKAEDTDSDGKEEGSLSSLTATIAFTDIKSASTAHKAEKKIGNNVLSSEYSSGFGATGSVVKRTHEPEPFPRGPPAHPAPFTNRKGFDEEADGFDVYYGPTQQQQQYSDAAYPSPQFAERGRPRERWPQGAPFGGRGGKWAATGQGRPFGDVGKDGFEKPKSSIPASSPTASQASSQQRKKKKSKSKSADRSQSRSSSNSSRSSSSSSESGSASDSKERPKSSAFAKSETQDSEIKDSEIEPGEREPFGILIKRLPLRSSDTSLRDGLFHEYKKYGKITAVQVSGIAETRYAIISFKQTEDAAKALEASQGKRFFGCNIQVSQHEGLEAEDCEFLTPEATLDEHSPKATRTLFLGNLEKEITIEELKERLEKYGEILDVDVKRQGAVTAYAFIQFTDISSVVKALKDLDGTSWGNTKLKVGFGKSMATPVVWLGNLAETVHEGFLCRQFSRFGALSHTVVDKENHRGLVFFLNPESAQYALPEMRNRIWNGKKIHIDYASRDCQDSFFKKMEQSGQLRPGERPDPRWMQKQIANEPHWEEGADPNFKRGGFTQFGRGRGRFQRGRGHFRGRGGSFEGGTYPTEEFPVRRKPEEYSQGNTSFMEDDSYERQLQEYGHSQRERRERSSQSPPGYEDVYYERGSQSGQDFEMYESHRYSSYRSVSPTSDREMDVNNEEFTQYKARTPSDERFYKLYEESRSRDRSHSSDSEQRFRMTSEVVRRRSRSRSPTMKLKRTKELPISYRSHSPPTHTDDDPYFHGDNSPTDSTFRKYENYRKRPGSVDDDKKGSVLLNTGLRKEIEAKSEGRISRKRSYDQLSPKRADSLQRLERQHSRGSRADSTYEYSAKELLTKVQRLRTELNERTGVKDSPSSGSSSDIDPSTLTEAELAKLHREKNKLLQKLNMMEDTGNNSDDSDTRHMLSKKARLEHKNLTKQEMKEKLKLLDETQNLRKLDSMRKKELLRDLKKSKSAGESKKDLFDYSEEDPYHSPHDLFVAKKRRKIDSDSDKRYRGSRDDEHGYSSDDDKERQDYMRQSSAHADLYSPKTRVMSSLDARLESDVFASHSKEDSRRVSSGSDNNKEQSEHSGRSRRHKSKKDNHITPLIPLGNDDMPDPETSDPRTPRGKCERTMVLPLPEFAQFIQFSPLPSPCHSPERYSDLPAERERPRASATGSGEQSPCFSPQSSSSKTHSPSQSPSGSGSDSKGNTNSDSGNGDTVPPGFPTETEQIDPDENKADSFDSDPDPTKQTVTETKPKNDDDDSFSDNNSDNDLTTDNLSIEERIRQLDEKWNKAQAVASITPKIIPDVDSVVGSTAPVSTALPSYIPSPIINQGANSQGVPSLYSKYKIRKRNDATGSSSEKSEHSEIVQTVLSKSSIFDQDSKRLGQTNDTNCESKELSPTSVNDNSPKSYSAWNKPDPKENPMVTVPGSLLDRLGQGSNGSFPTLSVNTTFPSVTNNVSINNPAVSSGSGLYFEKSDKVSPHITNDILDKNGDLLATKGVSDSEDINNIGDQNNSVTGDKSWQSENKVKHKDNFDKSCEEESAHTDLDKPENDIVKPERKDLVKENNVKYELEESNTKESESKDKISADANKSSTLSDNKVIYPEISLKLENVEEMDTSVNDTSVDNITDKSKSVKEESTISDVKVEVKEEPMEIKTELPVTEQPEKTKTEPVNEVKVKGILKKPSESDLQMVDTKSDVEPVKEVKETPVGKSEEKVISSDKDKQLHKQSGVKSEKDDAIKEPSAKRQKVSKEKEKRSDSSHRDDKHKKKDSDKKSESSHKSSSDKKDKDKDKSKHKSDKDKKDSEKKSSSSKEEKKDAKDEKKKKSDKKDKDKKEDKSGGKEGKEEKAEKVSKEKKEEKADKDTEKHTDKKDNKGEKKDKHEKKEKDGHKHTSKHNKSPEKKSKSHKETESKDAKDKAKETKETVAKDAAKETKDQVKESTTKDTEKEKPEVKEKEKPEGKEKAEKKSSEAKKEHKSSHKAKKSKDEKRTKDDTEHKKSKEENAENKKGKEEETKKVKDDHSEHKKKDDVNNRNNKDSPDKSKDVNRKEGSEKKSSEKAKDKTTGDKCKEEKSKNKEKENKDKDPDHSKSKGRSSNSTENNETTKGYSEDSKVEKTETEKEENKKSDSKKEEKKNKDSEMSKNSNSASKLTSKENDKKNSKSEKQGKNKSNECKSMKIKTPESSSKSKKEKDTPRRRDKDRGRDRDSIDPNDSNDGMFNGLTEEDRLIFAQFAEEPYMSMYDKVKRRSTEKKMHCEREQEEQKKLLHEYKRVGGKTKKGGLSDITESSEDSSDEDRKKHRIIQKSKKKFAFSSDDSDSSTDTNVLQTKSIKTKTQTKKPNRILDIYSSDSEEEDLSSKTPAKKPVTTKKKKAEVHRDNDHKFEFDSISDSDNKTSATQQAKPKTAPKSNKKVTKPKSEMKSTPKNMTKKDTKPVKPKRKDFDLKALFSDDSDESMLSDSSSDSDIMVTPKTKKKTFLPNHKNNDSDKKKMPRGSAIYTSSEESETDDEFNPMSPPKTNILPKKVEKRDSFFKEPIRKDRESDSFSSDHDEKFFEANRNRKVANRINNKHFSDSFESDGFSSDHTSPKYRDNKTRKKNNKISLDHSLKIEDFDKKLDKEIIRDEFKHLSKLNKNKKYNEIITDEQRFESLNKLDVTKVYADTLYEKETRLTNLTNKDNLPPVLADITREPMFKLDVEQVKGEIPTLKDLTLDPAGRTKNKKHKKENKKKKKNKEKPGKDAPKDFHELNKKSQDVKEITPKHDVKADNFIPDSDSENTGAVNRNLFDVIKSPPHNSVKKTQNKKEKKGQEVDHSNHNTSHDLDHRSDTEFLSDSEKHLPAIHKEKSAAKEKMAHNKDVFDFQDDDSSIKPAKDSHKKHGKTEIHDKKQHHHEKEPAPTEVHGVEIEYTTDEHDYKDEGNVCPIVETTEVVIEQAIEEKPEKEKKPRKKRGRKQSGKDIDTVDPTTEAVSALVKDDRPAEEIQTEIVPFETPVSNEQELVIDDGVTLHVEDETDKAVESILNDGCDETAKAVESILLDGMPNYAISEPVEPTPQLDQNYLQPEFAPSLPTVPQVAAEVETNTTATPLKGKKGRKPKRTKSGQADALLNENATKIVEGKQPFDLLNEDTFSSVISGPVDNNDDDDDGRLQIDFDPPKPETKQKKPRKQKQMKASKMNDAAALAAENKIHNLFGDQQKDGEINRDSLSSENSELERSKNEDLLFMDREDQRHDSDMMSPDERSTSDDITSPTDTTKVKSRRGRKPKNKDPATAPIPRTNSPRASRTMSPRSPRSNFDPRSPKSDSFDAKLNGPKSLVIDEGLDNMKGNKLGTNIFDFDDNDESSKTAPPPPQAPTPKQRKPYRRRKGEENMQSPNRAGLFSPEHKQEDKLVIASPECNGMFSPEHKVNFPQEKKGLFSPTFQPEEQKLEVKAVADDKPPEPLFKAFFEAKSKNEPEKGGPVLSRKNSKENDVITAPGSLVISNVDKTIDDVAKGLFENTDDESGNTTETLTQKKKQTRKGKEDDILKSPGVKSPGVKSPIKSPIAKSPMVKSPAVINPLNSPPPSTMHSTIHHQPLVLPGMGIGQTMPTTQPQIGEPQLAGHVPMMSPPIQVSAARPPLSSSHGPGPSMPDINKLPEPIKSLNSPPPKMVPHSPARSTLQHSPKKSASGPTVAQSPIATTTTVAPSNVTSPVPANATPNSMEDVLKGTMPGFLVPGISANSAMNVVQGLSTTATIAQTATVVTTMSDLQKRQQQMDKLAQEQQMQMEQKQAEQELQRQQEHHVKLKEQELKMREAERKELERKEQERKEQERKEQEKKEQEKKDQEKKEQEKKEQEKKEQEQRQEQERKEIERKNMEEKKKLQEELKTKEEKKKQLEILHEQLRQQQAQAAMHGVTIGPGAQPGQPQLLSPGAMQRARASLSSPADQNKGARPHLPAHHQMPPGAPFSLPGQHPGAPGVRPGQIPAHWAPGMVQLGQDELFLKHQQLQQQIAAQSFAEMQAQIAKQQAQQAQAQAKQQTTQQVGKPGPQPKNQQGPQGNKKTPEIQRPTPTQPQQQMPGKEAPKPGSQEAANQLTAQIKQQLAMQAKQQQQQGQQQQQPPHPAAQQPSQHQPQHPHLHPWPLAQMRPELQDMRPEMQPMRPDMPHMRPELQMQHIRPEGPRHPGPGMVPMPAEPRTTVPGPIPGLPSNPQQVQRVSPHPPTKSPTVAQTAPNMVHGFSQHQAVAPRAPSPAVAKTAERQPSAGPKWVATANSVPPRPGHPDVRPRVPVSEAAPITSRSAEWGMNGPTAQPSAASAPRPAHQQPPSAHQQQPEHALPLTNPQGQATPNPAEIINKDKFIQQQKQMELQRQEMIKQEMQRQQLRDQALHAKAQKEVAIHKERERAESLEREKREAQVTETRQSPAIRGMPGYPFVEPRPPSPNGKHPQSPAIDPRDPRFQQFAGHHPTDLRLGSSQSSAFSPATGSTGAETPHMYSQAEIQRLQNGMLPYPGLMIREPHLLPGHAPPYMLPSGVHLAYVAQQMEHQHLVDGRPPSRGTSRPPSNQPPSHTISPNHPQQQQQPDNRNQARGPPAQAMGPPTQRDPHPGDGSLLSLLQRYPVMWQGILGLKNDQCVVQMHFISGCQQLVKMSLPQQSADGTVQPLRIAQRMRLEQQQLEGVEKRMQMEKDYCMMLALPCGRDHTDIYQQTRAMSTGFIQYLQQKQAAGIVNVADPGSQQPAYVVHVFPPCDFSQTTLSRLGFDLLYQVKDLAHLIVIIATVA